MIGEPARRTPGHLFRAHLGRGVCMRQMKEYAAAVRDFDKALAVEKVKPDEAELADLFRQKAEAHRGLGERDEAAACLARADRLAGKPAAPPKVAPPPKAGGSIVGTWRFQGTNASGVQGDVLIAFNRDGSFSMSYALNAPGRPAQADTANGRYAYDDREVTFAEADGTVKMRRKASVTGNTLTLDLSGNGLELPLTRQN